jgi:hypothetical protein
MEQSIVETSGRANNGSRLHALDDSFWVLAYLKEGGFTRSSLSSEGLLSANQPLVQSDVLPLTLNRFATAESAGTRLLDIVTPYAS